ncbi:Got1/Sft2-like family-domain-containing protein, partial [Mycena filopes]
EIGVALTTFGGLFMLLGVMMFFDGALLALGNILFVSGLTLIIGPKKTFYFFARKQKLRGTVCFLGGIVLVFLKWPFVGMIVETFGFLNLFGDFFPVIVTFLRQMPFIGTALSLPYIRDASPRSQPSPRLVLIFPGRGSYCGFPNVGSIKLSRVAKYMVSVWTQRLWSAT